MDLKRIADKAKDLVDKRGGTDSLKEDASELKDIASGKGSLADKAKAAVEAVKDPGAEGAGDAAQRDERAAATEPPTERGSRRRGRRHAARQENRNKAG
jgi:hypothetical protein